MKKTFRLTAEGLEELKAELKNLISQRGHVAERIKAARELGDLSENAEYQTAREEQDRLEARISELDHILQNSQLIKKPKSDGHVSLGSKVTLKDGGKPLQYQVVGTMEADPTEGKISDESPIGKALLGKKVGDKVELKTPAGNHTYKITDIS
ncbi:MAG TPA: transcription elongation factor GreA [Candidatus Saccharimonadales bacterium]|nr:transcription elongation factor GreA [Candidatus Saccharimonadales bacterium]